MTGKDTSDRQLLIETLVKSFLIEPNPGSVLNISQSGFAMESVHPLNIGEAYAFFLSSPKKRDASILLEGKVVRCQLDRLAELADGGGQQPVYISGVELQFSRDQREQALLNLIRLNTLGEKRVGSPRVHPINRISVTVGRGSIRKVIDLTPTNIIIETELVPDNQNDWCLLLDLSGCTIAVETRQVATSKKNNSNLFSNQLEFLHMGEEPYRRLTNFLKHHNLLDNSVEE